MSVKYNKNGTVTIDYRYKGKRYRQTLKGSKTFGKEVLRKIQTEIAEGKFFPERKKNNITFKQAADKYWDLHGSKTKGSLQSRYVLNIILKEFGNKPLDKITTEDIQLFYNRDAAKSSSSTANRHFTIIRAVFNKAIKLDLFKGRNPCSNVCRKRENPPRIKFLSKEQISTLLEIAKDDTKALLQCALMTGMRRGEILALNWEDIDITNKIIHIRDSKSGKGRDIPMIPALVEVFSKFKGKSGKVFKVSKVALRHRVEHLYAQADITGFTFHDLRHTFASHFVMNGGTLEALKPIMGHSSMDLTLRYAHLSPTHIQKQITVLNSLF